MGCEGIFGVADADPLPVRVDIQGFNKNPPFLVNWSA